MSSLKNWIYDQYKNNADFTDKKFAQSLGLSAGYFSAIKNNRSFISYQVAMLIQEKTGNAVSALDLLNDNHKAIPRKTRGKKQKVSK